MTTNHEKLRRLYVDTRARVAAGDEWLQDDDGTFADRIRDLASTLPAETAAKAVAAFRALGVHV